MRNLLAVFGAAAVDQAVLQRALALGWPDLEDGVCAAAAEAAGCDVIVTRDPKGFPDSVLVPAVDTLTAVALLAGGGPGHVGARRTLFARSGWPEAPLLHAVASGGLREDADWRDSVGLTRSLPGKASEQCVLTEVGRTRFWRRREAGWQG